MKNWFQNRRAKARRALKEGKGDAPKKGSNRGSMDAIPDLSGESDSPPIPSMISPSSSGINVSPNLPHHQSLLPTHHMDHAKHHPSNPPLSQMNPYQHPQHHSQHHRPGLSVQGHQLTGHPPHHLAGHPMYPVHHPEVGGGQLAALTDLMPPGGHSTVSSASMAPVTSAHT